MGLRGLLAPLGGLLGARSRGAGRRAPPPKRERLPLAPLTALAALVALVVVLLLVPEPSRRPTVRGGLVVVVVKFAAALSPLAAALSPLAVTTTSSAFCSWLAFSSIVTNCSGLAASAAILTLVADSGLRAKGLLIAGDAAGGVVCLLASSLGSIETNASALYFAFISSVFGSKQLKCCPSKFSIKTIFIFI